MTIEYLSQWPVALALSFRYLSIEDRNRCWQTCCLFRKILENPDYQTLLWAPQIFRTMHVDNLRFTHIRNALSRLRTTVHRNIIPLPERHTDFAFSLHSYGCLLLSCDHSSKKCAGEVLIWKKENNSYCLSKRLSQFSKRWYSLQLRTTCTVQGDWLIRSALDHEENGEFSVKVDVWKLNEKTAEVTELFATKIPSAKPYPKPSSNYVCAPALRDKSTLYIPLPLTQEVQVAIIDETPRLTTRIDLSNIGLSRITSLTMRGDELIVHTPNESVSINRTDPSLIQEKTEEVLHSDNGWKVLQDIGFKILRNDQVHCIINVPADFDNRKWSLRTHLGMHHFLLGYGQVCHVYTLWNMNQNGTPNRTITIPKDTTITAVHMHEENVILSTLDGENGEVWQA